MSDSMIPVETEKALFKIFWLWMSIAGVIVSAITAGAWVLISLSIGPTAEKSAAEAAKKSLADWNESISDLQAKVRSIQEDSQRTLERVREGDREVSNILGQVRANADNAAMQASQAQSALNSLRLELQRSSEILGILQKSEKFIDDIVNNHAFQEAVGIKVLSAFDGAVVAFLHECPTEFGWSSYRSAEGRFLIGVGRGPLEQFVAFEKTGGVEYSLLDVAQLPDHTHVPGTPNARGRYLLTASEEGIQGAVRQEGVNSDLRVTYETAVATGGVSRSGTQKRIQNMPPYIALYYCQKQ